jgi:hypothetical protein
MPFVHSLPFHLSFSGKADVTNGFVFYPSESGGTDYIASFRGRKLIGHQCELSPALTGNSLIKSQLVANSFSFIVVTAMELSKGRLTKTRPADDFSLFEWVKEEDAQTPPKISFDRLASLSQFRYVVRSY